MDKVYLWLCIISCLALAVAGSLAIIEIGELSDQTIVAGSQPF
jgi:hypothetical protein